MKKPHKIALIVTISLIIFSLLPIWRSGERRNLNLWQFAKNHTIFGHEPMYEISTHETP